MSPARVYLLLTGGSAGCYALAFTLSMVYQVQVVGLSPLELVLVGTVLEASVFVGEVPTGIVADVYSRRLSVLIGLVLVGCGLVLYADLSCSRGGGCDGSCGRVAAGPAAPRREHR